MKSASSCVGGGVSGVSLNETQHPADDGPVNNMKAVNYQGMRLPSGLCSTCRGGTSPSILLARPTAQVDNRTFLRYHCRALKFDSIPSGRPLDIRT